MFSPAGYEIVLSHIRGRLPLVLLVLANLFPLYAVLLGYWDVGALIILYWAENLVIGFYSLLKILLAGFTGVRSLLGNLFVCGFFLLHFGGFVGAHGLFVIGFFPLGGTGIDMAGLEWPFILVFVEMLWRVCGYMFHHMPELMLTGLFMLFLSHGASFLINYLVRGEYRATRANVQMGAPYGRIVLMHVSIIAGGFLVAATGSGVGMLLVLIALKIAADVSLHRRSHRKLEVEV